MHTFPAAPMSMVMKIISAAILVVVVGGCSAMLIMPFDPGEEWARGLIAGAVALVLLLLGYFARHTPVSMVLQGRTLVVNGLLGGEHRYALSGAVEHPAPQLRLRLFGSAGWLGVTGLFRNAAGQNVWVHSTGMGPLVQVGTARRPIVVSPADPDGFAKAVRALAPDPTGPSHP